MNKSVIFSAAILAVFLTLSAAGAGVSWGDVAPSEDAPLLAACTGSNVNMRAEPNTSGKVLTRLSKGQALYAIETKDSWVRVITDKGYKGWVFGQYCAFDKDCESAENRWKAAYKSSVFFDADALKRITGQKGVKSSFKENEIRSGLGGYAEYQLSCPPLRMLCLDEGGKDALLAVGLTSDEYSVAGLRVGDDMSGDAAKNFGKMLKKVEGWVDGPDELEDGENWWYMNAVVDSSTRPVRGFTVGCENGKVKDIWWCVIVID